MNSLTKSFPIIKNFIKFLSNNQDDFTKLHRWCTIVSPIYKNSCNWEKKMDMASMDNCYHNHNKISKN